MNSSRTLIYVWMFGLTSLSCLSCEQVRTEKTTVIKEHDKIKEPDVKFKVDTDNPDVSVDVNKD